MSGKALRFAVVVGMALAMLFSQYGSAIAGTTGGISGVVTTADGAPVAGASVSAVSPSASASTKTDATGHFVFLTLLPDDYTIVVAKPGAIETYTLRGVEVLADQINRQTITVTKAIKTLGTVTATSQVGLVRPGSTTTVYSVDATTTDLGRDIGGSAYNQQSIYGIAQLIPGTSFHRGYSNNSFTIRGGEPNQVGFEYDGVPVNRAFDNDNALSGSIVGMQELQVYTGNEPASAGAQSSTGFVNQVIKSGTYPGSTSVTLSLGAPAFYNGLLLENGGATATGRFSYYLANGDSDIRQRAFTQFDGIGLYQWLWGVNAFNEPISFWGSDAPPCNPDGQDPFSDPFVPPSKQIPAPTGGSPGCVMFSYPPSLFTNDLQSNRDLVTNFHYEFPHVKDTGKDDLQFLWATGYQSQDFRTSIFDSGGLKQIEAFNRNYNITPFWSDSVQFPSDVAWGTTIDPANMFPQIPLVAYKQPGSGQAYRCADLILQIPGSCFQESNFSLIPGNARTGQTAQYGITKLQFTKNLSQTSYLRVYGYTLFSGFFTNGAPAAGSGGLCCYAIPGFGNSDTPPADFELSTHTRGATAQYSNQLSPKHLLTVTANYTTASTTNWSNSQADQFHEDIDGQGQSASNLVSFDAHGTPTCYIYGYFADLGPGAIGQPTSCTDFASRGTFADPAQSLAFIPTSLGPESCGPCYGPYDNTIIQNTGTQYDGMSVAEVYGQSPAAAAGAHWIVSSLGAAGTINTVRPVFTSYSISDQWRPTDKLLIVPGVRLEQQEYILPNSNTPDYNFWFANARAMFWYNPLNDTPIMCGGKGTVNVDCNHFSVNGIYASAQCPLTGGCTGPNAPVHPDCQNGHICYTNITPPSFKNTVFVPSIGATYTFNPDTVVKFDIGKGADPVASSAVESLDVSGYALAAGSFGGDFSIAHHLQPRTATNVDFSYERHFKGTDISMSVTPFYRNTQHQYISNSSDSDTYTKGLELALQKGHLNQNGWTTYVAFTYTDEKMRFLGNALGQNPINNWNLYVDSFNSLTRGGDRNGNKGSPCYNAAVNSGQGGPSPAGDCVINGQTITLTQQGQFDGSVVNPFYFWPTQGYYDPKALYYYNNLYVPTSDSGFGNGARLDAISPYQIAGFVSYRHNRLQIAPTFIVWGGTHYGSPLDIMGLDPRTCPVNQYGFDAFDPGVLGGGTDAYGHPLLATDAPNPGMPNYIACGGNYLSNTLGIGFEPIVPNPYTKQFPSWGEYTNPWHLSLNAIANYDLNPRTTLQLRLDSLYNYCWGGSSEPWTKDYPPNQYVCGYQYNPFNNHFYYNGKSPTDQSANGPPNSRWYNDIYAPVVDTWPLNATFSIKIKI